MSQEEKIKELEKRIAQLEYRNLKSDFITIDLKELTSGTSTKIDFPNSTWTYTS